MNKKQEKLFEKVCSSSKSLYDIKDNQKYYTSGQFARMSHVTLRTIRYYDKQKILKPSFVNISGDASLSSSGINSAKNSEGGYTGISDLE